MVRGFDKKALKNRIIEARERKGINQAKLAQEAGITPAAISQIENGHRVPTIPVLHRIATVLGVSMDYLSGKTDESEVQDLLQHENAKAFFRGFQSLDSEDQETISKLIEFLKNKES
ncbi:MAG: hypothetical protein AVW05_03705 [Hadesarchaea archaeon DG-33]|nr:MAG: hypothetical protein AVW05_03705 [Hadesarchaea archaeon DG-33]